VNVLLAALGVIGISASGPIMAATAAPALAIAFWRNALGSVVMGGSAAWTQRRQFRPTTRTERGWIAVAAVALALHFACFITALQLTSVAAATALVCLQSAWIALFALLRRVRLRPAVLAGLLIALAGALLITGFDATLSPRAAVGDALGLAGGVLAGIYTLAGSRARRTLPTTVYTTLCYGACAVILLLLCLVFGQPLVGFSAAVWLGILAVTVAAQLLGHSVFNYLVGHLSALVVSMIILLEIPGAAVLAALFLGEKLPGGTYLGLVLILAGLAVVVLGQGRGNVRAPALPD
jgi:drug/metabolite transporter (DMT)-like permease